MSNTVANKAGLCVVFNHPFPRQIPFLRSIYGDRFSKILFIIPFHEDEADDIVTVYQGSYRFNAMIVEARKEIEDRFSDCSHVLFVADDLLISKHFDEASTVDVLGLADAPAYISSCDKLGGAVFHWHWQSALPYKWRTPMDSLLGSGAEKAKSYLPGPAAVRELCDATGIDGAASTMWRDTDEQRIDRWYYGRLINQHFFQNPNLVGENGVLDLEYPFFTGYSDIFCLPMATFKPWIKILGLLSALDIFPEISIPTSLVWTFGRPNTAASLGLKTSIIWDDRHLTDDIEWVIGRFKAGDHYIHPVKSGRHTGEAYEELIRRLK
jgi:hypothetical protein